MTRTHRSTLLLLLLCSGLISLEPAYAKHTAGTETLANALPHDPTQSYRLRSTAAEPKHRGVRETVLTIDHAEPRSTSNSEAAVSTVVSDNDQTISHMHAGSESKESDSAILVEAGYTFDVWTMAAGGVADGSRYLDNFDLVAEADLGRLIGWEGATMQVYGLYNNGKSFNDLAGDAQITSNIETGVKALRLYEMWINQELGDTASLKVGLYDLNSEFDVLESSGLFVGSAHGIGTDIAQSGEAGPSIFR